MNVLDNRRLRQSQLVIVPAHQLVVVLETLPTVVLLGQAMLLDHLAHGPVENHNALPKELVEVGQGRVTPPLEARVVRRQVRRRCVGRHGCLCKCAGRMGEGDGGVSECEAGMLGAGRAEAKACHATVQEKALLILGGVCVRCVRGVRVEYALGQGKADLRWQASRETPSL